MQQAYKDGQNAILNLLKQHSDFVDIPASLKAGNSNAADFLKFQAFTTAVVQDNRIRSEIKRMLVLGAQNGTAPAEVKKAIQAYLKPFTSVKDVINVPKARLASAIGNIYHTNMSLAFGAGQQRAMLENSDLFPYWEYISVNDSRTRPTHRALHGKIFSATDTQFYPPIGFRCRCTARPLTAAKALGFPITKSSDVNQKELANAEFIGNKQANFLRWLQENEPTHPVSTKLIQIAIDRLQAAVEKNNYTIVNIEGGGVLKISKQRIEHSKKSKNETDKFEKELRMAKVYASNGFNITMLNETDRHLTFDAFVNNTPADFKSLSSHNNIWRETRKAIRDQGADVLLFEFSNDTKEIHEELLSLRKKGIKAYYYFSGKENSIYKTF